VKKETVRIELPHPPAVNPPEPTLEPRETIRVQWRVDETRGSSFSAPSQSAPEDVSSADIPTLPKPRVACFGFTSRAPESGSRRTTLKPEPLRSSQEKARSLIDMPQVAPKNPISSLAAADNTSILLY
jgi:hypothetical protein